MLCGFDGWLTPSSQMSEVVKDASVNVARSMVFSILINGASALAILLAVLFCAGDIGADVANSPSQYPFIQILDQAVGSTTGATVMTALTIILEFCSATGTLAAASRMTWSFARDRGLPGSKWLSRVCVKRSFESFLPRLINVFC